MKEQKKARRDERLKDELPVLVSTRWLMADAEEWDEKEERRLHKTQDARQRPATFQTSDPPAHSDPPSDQQPKPDTRLPRKRDEKTPDEAVAVLWGGYACAFDVRRRQSLSYVVVVACSFHVEVELGQRFYASAYPL